MGEAAGCCRLARSDVVKSRKPSGESLPARCDIPKALGRAVDEGRSRGEVLQLQKRLEAIDREVVVQAATVDWLASWPWEVFVSLTVPDGRSAGYVERRARRWLRRCGRRIHGRRREELLHGPLVWERQNRGDWHAHALLAGWRGWSFREAHEEWACDGFAWLRTVRDEPRAVRYVAKYAIKGGRWDTIGKWGRDPQGDLELLPPRAGCVAPRASPGGK